MATQRRGGIIQCTRNGVLLQAKGNFTYNLGRPKRDAIVGADAVHGYKDTPQVAFIEGEVTDGPTIDLDGLVTAEDETIALNLANGKVIVLRNAWYAAEGNVQTEEGNIQVRWEGLSGEEIA